MIDLILIWIGVTLNVAGLFYNIGFRFGERKYAKELLALEAKIERLSNLKEDHG